jgi:5-methyltetrahydrofolate--homocysteine methyltransferase
MNRQTFRELCAARPLILDGATGTELMKHGLPVGVCPEKWAVEHPDALAEIARAYRGAGSDIVYACTFGANRAKLADFGLAEEIVALNRRAVEIARAAVNDGAEKSATFIAGDLAPTGKMLEPYGDATEDEIGAVYREQAETLREVGADLLVIETMMDLAEAKVAAQAARGAAPDLPIMVSMTFQANGKTMFGADPQTAVEELSEIGIDAFGCNCSAGPEAMLPWIAELRKHTILPLIAKPNAGTPKVIDGKTVFDMGAEEFAANFPALVAAGANLIGGCCGSTPAHIAAVRRIISRSQIIVK